MPGWWRKWNTENNNHREAGASTSEEVFDSDLEINDDDFCESPTLVTVDDGRGGIKHIKVVVEVIDDDDNDVDVRSPDLWKVRQRASSPATTPSTTGGSPPGRGWGSGSGTWSGRSWLENTSSVLSHTMKS